ncbi:amidohydrolase [Herbiconiux moechotypicola]|uniref:Amidohydrolase n=1 Tax=Herbiconiux moechotypicola TaxID=637393 RepID=A0ABP5QFG4_9MICO|nr:amidohydrolase [Herbiconiux moechotypicola]MCS5730003.1 amidohydrolase [Herbiconiux moechotypicola]
MDFTERQLEAIGIVDDLLPDYSAFHREIWGYAEPAWREYRSVAAYVAKLREEGFEVEEGSGDMPTAFHATWGSGGPSIGLYAEYDASPGASQETVPYRQPREGLHPWAPGFTDAHSALGVGALAGAVALKRTLERAGGGATIHFFGEPAEKVCGSKSVHAAKGYYDPLDAAISFHPLSDNTVVGELGGCLYWSAVFTFECTDDEPWLTVDRFDSAEASQHNSVRSPGAVDALALMISTTKATRENMFPRTGLWSLNEVVLGGANATADNQAPRISQIQFSWRSPLVGIQEQIYDVLARCAKHVAGITNTVASVRWVTKIRPALPNLELARATEEIMTSLGPPARDESVAEFGRDLERALGLPVSEQPFLGVLDTITPIEVRDARIRETIPPWQDCTGADDYSEYSWHAPTVRFFTAKPLLKQVPELSHWSNNAMNGLAEAIDPTWVYGAKIIAATALRLIDDPALLAAATEEYATRFGAAPEEYRAPMLPADFAPPVDLPWPEYVTTARGYEWVLPTTGDLGERL